MRRVSPFEAVVKHDGRLGVLCCLVVGESLTIPQLSARIGRPLNTVTQFVELLESFRIVKPTGKFDGSYALYVAKLDEHPDWVREVVEDHRRS